MGCMWATIPCEESEVKALCEIVHKVCVGVVFEEGSKKWCPYRGYD